MTTPEDFERQDIHRLSKIIAKPASAKPAAFEAVKGSCSATIPKIAGRRTDSPIMGAMTDTGPFARALKSRINPIPRKTPATQA